MRKYESVSKQFSELKDIICDCCGKSCHTPDGLEYMELKADWGYGSDKDLTRFTAQVCEKCVDEKFDFISFKKEELTLDGTTIKVK